MTILDTIRWGLRQIRKRLLESILIILGIALGVGVICCVVGLMEGLTKQTSSIMNDQNMRVFQLVSRQNNFQFEDIGKPLKRIGLVDEEKPKVTFEDYLKLKEFDLEGVELIWFSEMRAESLASEEEGPRPIFDDPEEEEKWYRDNMLEFRLASPEIFQAAELSLVTGDLFRGADLLDKSKVIVIGDELADSLFPNEDPIGKEIKLHLGSYKVIGVVHRESDEEEVEYIAGLGMVEDLNRQGFIPFFSYVNEFQQEENNELREFYIQAKDSVELEVFRNQLKNYVTQYLAEGIDVTGMYTFQSQGKKTIFVIGKIMGLFSCAALLIASINILNLMMAKVLRRYKQIGISTALGASRRDVFNLFLAEALILGIFGSILGVGLGFGGLKLLSKLTRIPLGLSILNWLVGIGVALLTSLIFGLYPASQAARVRPVDALKMD